MQKFKIATFGCSHSSYMAGEPWPIPLSKMIPSDLVLTNSSGSGNEINVLKLRQVLEECKPDLAIVQLTDPNRLVLGFDYESCHKNINFLDYIGDNNAMDVPYYTFNHTGNIENLEKFLGEKFHKDVDRLIIRHIITSEHNLYHKVVHTMLAMEGIARSYNTKLVFFSWSIDIQELIEKNGYSKVTKTMNIVPGYIEDFVRKKNLKPVPEGFFACGHHPTENHVVIARDFILPYLLENKFVPTENKSVPEPAL